MPEPAYIEQTDTRPVSHGPSDKKYGSATRHQKLPNKIIKEQEDFQLAFQELSEKTCDCGLTGIHQQFLNKITKRKHKIENGNLNIKYTKTIDSGQYKKLGELLSNHRMGLRAACTITDDELQSFFEGIGKEKTLKELDISCSKNLTVTGFFTVARFVEYKETKILKLGACKLTSEHVDVLHESLFKGYSSGTFEELDISYNPALEPDDYTKIGQIVGKCNVKKLGLAGCKLNNEHLEKLGSRDCPGVDKIVMGDNTSIGKGIAILAEIVKKWEVEELDISGCMFTKCELQVFRDGLKGTQIRRLNLSDYDRNPDETYIEEVCKFLPLVTESLIIQFRSISASCRRMLKEQPKVSC